MDHKDRQEDFRKMKITVKDIDTMILFFFISTSIILTIFLVRVNNQCNDFYMDMDIDNFTRLQNAYRGLHLTGEVNFTLPSFVPESRPDQNNQAQDSHNSTESR